MTGPTIAHVITSLTAGGAERTLVRLVTSEASGTARHVVITLTPGGIFESSLRDADVKLHSLEMRPGVPSLSALFRLVRILRRVRPDVIVSWLYHADLMATLAYPLVRPTRLVWNLRGTRKDAATTRRSIRFVVAVLSRLSRVPWAIAANSHAGRWDHSAAGYRSKRWIYLPNGFESSEWHPDTGDRRRVRKELGVNEDDVAVVMVARRDPQKDHASLLDAVTQLVERGQGVALVLIGRGVDEISIHPTIRPRVITLGERNDVARLLRGCDIGVLSSAYGEGLPNAVGEAMLTGLPCVATDTGDTRSLIGDTGIVVPPRDPVALANGIERLLDMSSRDRRELGLRARQRVADRYSMEVTIAAYERLWQDLES